MKFFDRNVPERSSRVSWFKPILTINVDLISVSPSWRSKPPDQALRLPSIHNSTPQITFTSGMRHTLIILTFRSTEVCHQAVPEFSHRTIYFYNPRARKFLPNRVDYITNYSTTKKLSNSSESIEVDSFKVTQTSAYFPIANIIIRATGWKKNE